jgi:hypothetical protein
LVDRLQGRRNNRSGTPAHANGSDRFRIEPW